MTDHVRLEIPVLLNSPRTLGVSFVSKNTGVGRLFHFLVRVGFGRLFFFWKLKCGPILTLIRVAPSELQYSIGATAKNAIFDKKSTQKSMPLAILAGTQLARDPATLRWNPSCP